MTADLSLGDTQLIINECHKDGCTREQTAYILATARWETNHTMKPVQEAYWLSDKWRRQNLRYYPWHGRGYVQITWQRNYRHAGDQLGVDLMKDPDSVMRPAIAVRILVRGMMQGWFTNHKLPDHVNEAKTDFAGARRVVNGTDKAQAIAALAREYVEALSLTPAPQHVSETPKNERIGWGAIIAAILTAIRQMFKGGRS